MRELPYESDSTFYRVDLAIKNAPRCAYLYLEYDTVKTLPEDFARLNNLRGITFRYCTSVNWGQVLTVLSKEPKLEYLEISVSKINKLNAAIGAIKQLRSLNLKGNNLQTVADQTTKLPNLRIVNLSYNPGMRWDETFKRLADCDALEELDLSSNGLTNLDEGVGALTKLKRLTLSANFLSKLPNELTKLTALEDLELSNNTDIDWKQAATPVSQLASLKRLSLTGNKMAELPAKIFALTNLEEFYANGNELTGLPEQIGNLTNLRVLDIGSSRTGQTRNEIADFPKSLGKLTKLEVLNMNGTYMLDLPSGISDMKALRELYINWCGLASLKHLDGATNLEVLEAAHNYFSEIPAWVGDMRNLRVLKLNGNFFPAKQVPHVQQLPATICQLENLEVLTLNDQLISALPDCIGNLKKLKTLTVRNNKIETLPAGIAGLTALQELDLKANMLTGLVDLNAMTQLQTLNLSFNPDLNLNAEGSRFSKLQQLKSVDISFLPASNQTIAALKESLPKTEIVYYTYDDLKFNPGMKDEPKK